MNTKRETKFIQNITPYLKRLASQWVEPGSKSPEGNFYGCLYCDMECGGHERHDHDCISDLAKKVIEEFDRIDADQSYKTDFNNKMKPEDEITEIADFIKTRFAISTFFAVNLYNMIPLDYSEKGNQNIGCYCNSFTMKNQHTNDCIMKGLSKAFAELYKPE